MLREQEDERGEVRETFPRRAWRGEGVTMPPEEGAAVGP